MKFRIGADAEWYEFDQNSMTVLEAREIERHTGMGLRSFSLGLQDGKVDSMIGMIYLAQRRAGRVVKWSDFDEVNIAAIEVEADEEEKAAADKAAAENGSDPTPPLAIVAAPSEP